MFAQWSASFGGPSSPPNGAMAAAAFEDQQHQHQHPGLPYLPTTPNYNGGNYNNGGNGRDSLYSLLLDGAASQLPPVLPPSHLLFKKGTATATGPSSSRMGQLKKDEDDEDYGPSTALDNSYHRRQSSGPRRHQHHQGNSAVVLEEEDFEDEEQGQEEKGKDSMYYTDLGIGDLIDDALEVMNEADTFLLLPDDDTAEMEVLQDAAGLILGGRTSSKNDDLEEDLEQDEEEDFDDDDDDDESLCIMDVDDVDDRSSAACARAPARLARKGDAHRAHHQPHPRTPPASAPPVGVGLSHSCSYVSWGQASSSASVEAGDDFWAGGGSD